MIIDYFNSEAYDLMVHINVVLNYMDLEYGNNTTFLTIPKNMSGSDLGAIFAEKEETPKWLSRLPNEWRRVCKIAEEKVPNNILYATNKIYTTYDDDEAIIKVSRYTEPIRILKLPTVKTKTYEKTVIGPIKKTVTEEYQDTIKQKLYTLKGSFSCRGGFLCKESEKSEISGYRYEDYYDAGVGEAIRINKNNGLPYLKQRPKTLEEVRKLLLTNPEYIQILEPDDLVHIQKENPDIDLKQELANLCTTGVAAILDYQHLHDVEFSEEEMQSRTLFRDNCVKLYQEAMKKYDKVQEINNSVSTAFKKEKE